MAHLIPMSDPGTFSFEKGIAFGGRPLGHEVFFYQGKERQEELQRIRAAAGQILASEDPGVQQVRQRVDDRYNEYIAGAPADFTFKPETGSILGFLASADFDTTEAFFTWHVGHFKRLTEAIESNRPALREYVAQHVSQLIDLQLLPSESESIFDKIAQRVALSAIDSFDGSLILGRHTKPLWPDPNSTVLLSHMFDDGYTMGDPAKAFFHAGLHEYAHEAHYRRGEPAMDANPLLEHTIIEHCIGALSDQKDPYDLMATTDSGFYVVERKLFALVIGDEAQRIGVGAITRMLVSPDDRTFNKVQQQFGKKFSELFPEYGEDAWDVFVQGYTKPNLLKLHQYISQWHDQALDRTT